ncbi:ankyrin repeat-containing protein At5g02620-like [Humulus lupulus]|uniref:ankyrin repeat-containing protein At5g02620-like n=1 Tax=Humulus lupulus TaxID=3486 RepID=UPI002B4118DC|nr:ankyrin repeat-containing protein At5g02620-like [Humulus lupulus]
MASSSNTLVITRMDSKLFQAAVNGEIEVFKSTNELRLDLLLTPEMNTVLHVNIIASETQDESFVKEILDMCPPLLLQTNARGETPLLMAARYGHGLIVQLLINRAKLLEQNDHLEMRARSASIHIHIMMMRTRNEEEDTALHEAVRFQHLEVVRILTREDPHFSYSANEAGETPLYIAVEGGYLKLVDQILTNCTSPATQGPIGRNVLHAAVMPVNAALTRMLLGELSNLTKQPDEEGLIPLHHAVGQYIWSGLEIIEMLLEKDESSAYIKNKQGKAALHIAASDYNRGYEIMKKILSRCPDNYEVVDNEGRNFLHYVVTEQSLPTVKLILEHSYLSNYLLDRKDNEGNTPLLHMLATSPKYPENLQALLSHSRVNRMSFNKQNKNILDMAYSLDHKEYNNKREVLEFLYTYPMIRSCIRKSSPIDDGRRQILTNLKKRKDEQKERIRTAIANYRESTLVAATLIATVTFAAGFTLPGGYMSSEAGHRQQAGSAVLSNSIAFRAFMITDTIAMMLSTTAVFINLFMTIASVNQEGNEKFESNYEMSMNFTMCALGFMVIAFVTGMYAVLSLSIALAIATCVIGLSFFVLMFFITKARFKGIDFSLKKFQLIRVG